MPPLYAFSTIVDATVAEMISGVASLNVDKTNRGGVIVAQNHICLYQKALL